MSIDATPLWEEAKKRTAEGSPWATNSAEIAKLLGVEEISNEDLEASYDPKWANFFHFPEPVVWGSGFFEITFHRA